MSHFTNTPYLLSDSFADEVTLLRHRIFTDMQNAKNENYARDLQGVLDYCSLKDPHHFEGRSFSIEKQSFSVSEIQKAVSLPIEQTTRYLLYRYYFNHYPRNKLVSDFPIVVCIEPTSVCNLRCTMCFQVDKDFTDTKANMGSMDFGLFKHIIDECVAEGLVSIVMSSRGEPSLHNKLAEMISYARISGILDIKVNTNATTLTPTLSRKLLDAYGDYGISTLVFSVDSAEKSDYERIRVGANFESVVENVRTFKKIKDSEYPRSSVQTRISMTIIDEKQSIERAREYWKPLVDEFAFHNANNRSNTYHNKGNELRWCSQLFERMYVWFDGTVNPCDEDYRSALTLGKIPNNSLKEIWHGQKMTNYRQLHTTGKSSDLFPCDRCHRVNDY